MTASRYAILPVFDFDIIEQFCKEVDPDYTSIYITLNTQYHYSSPTYDVKALEVLLTKADITALNLRFDNITFILYDTYIKKS